MYYATNNGVEKRIESWKIIVPLHNNQRKQFREELISNIKSTIIDEFSGFTAVNAVGSWKSGHQVFDDENLVILVDVPANKSSETAAFFISLKQKLMKELSQEKIYVSKEGENSELLSVNEFLQELGFEIPADQPQSLAQENIEKLVNQSEVLKSRLSYKTLSIERDFESNIIIWEREILGMKLKTTIKDYFPKDAVVLAVDNIETCFREEMYGKTFVIIGDYEFQSYILDKEKRRYVVGSPKEFTKFDQKSKEPLYGPHAWHGTLTTSEFIPVFVEQILVNYIILREIGVPRKEIKLNVGSDGSFQHGGGKVLACPAPIPVKEVQEVIIEKLSKAIAAYETGSIDDIALMQAKALNRFHEKKAMAKAKTI
jgi:hypothetical protein